MTLLRDDGTYKPLPRLRPSTVENAKANSPLLIAMLDQVTGKVQPSNTCYFCDADATVHDIDMTEEREIGEVIDVCTEHFDHLFPHVCGTPNCFSCDNPAAGAV